MPEIVIAGGGVIGLATAWELTQRGHSVQLFDPDPGSGASRAAAGMLAPVAEVVWDQPTLYPLMIEAARRYPEFAATISEQAGRSVGYLTTETFVCAGDAADRASLRELCDMQQQLGMQVEPITARAARQLEPALGPGCVGAVHIPGDHQIDPRQLVAALLDILGPVVQRAQVTEVLWDGDRAAGVRLADGTCVPAEEVLLAAGLGITEIAGLPEHWHLPQRPVHGDVARLRVPEHLQPLLSRTIRGVVRGFPVYLVPRADGSIVLGATSREDTMAGVSAGGVYQLLRDAQRLVPAILECEITEIIARARPGSPDDVPIVGRIAEGLCVSAGYFRHGILLTPLGASLGADVVTNTALADDLAAAVDPHRFSHGA
ncbi:glycine oxidase ThiO [Corynebacterium sp. TAE3-ERU12]|uniref:glycine oxidase ThiO n=1 Tax=Corynebacterium sp. TAE3-ERU12 TaxID=2849491 RepID=UPI001C46D3D3|nr:glycine oxidase ThiO [Corynebacterium sp. TAE3-ERU12]MBV7295301.1 glycine oxidase ThiO [Corynebacterium sp. TAE3-ERU12]